MKVMKTPKTVEISITNRCNLKCSYCSHFSSAGDSGTDLIKEEWIQFFKELNDCAVMDVTIEGGEPFLRNDLRELISAIVNNRMRFNILSNGTLISDEIAEYISSTNRCNSVQVSIDGSMPETHDACRGNGNFKKAIKGIGALKKYNIPVTVRVTIHRHNVNDLDQIAKLLLEDLQLPGFSTNAASHLGLCRKYAADIQLTTDERSQAMKTLLKLNKKYNGRISATAGPLAEAKTWVEMEDARRSGKELIPGRGFLRGCGGVFNKLAIRADGTITPCIQMSHLELGRINRDKLKDVWQEHPTLNKLRNRRNIPLSEFEFCEGCDYLNYCTGNCPALAYTFIGKNDHPSPDACLKRFLENGGELPDGKT